MVGKYLDISTAHFTKDTLAILGEDYIIIDCVIAHKKYFDGQVVGAFVHVPSEEEENEPGNIVPSDLKKVFSYARERGCSWLIIDRDGDTIDELPILYRD